MDFLPDLVVDTSALVAILLPEADGPLYLDRLETAHCAAVSSVSMAKGKTWPHFPHRCPTFQRRIMDTVAFAQTHWHDQPSECRASAKETRPTGALID